MPREGILQWWKRWNAQRTDVREIEDKPPVPVVVVGTMGSGGEVMFGNSATVGPPLRTTSLEDNSGSIDTHLDVVEALAAWERPTVNVSPTSAAAVANANQRVVYVEQALTGGAATNVTLVAGASGYQACATILGVWSDTDFDPVLIFQDEDDTAAAGCPASGIACNVGGAKMIYWFQCPICVSIIADNKALEVDISGGSGTEAVGIFLLRHYET